MTPTHQTTASAGADVVCAKTVTIHPGETAIVHTGAYVPSGLPRGIFLMMAIRSSMALKRRLTLCNGVGIIDADYPDEICALILNLNTEPVTIEKGERIAQLIPMQYVAGVFPVLDTERSGGFGSTGQVYACNGGAE